MSCLVLGKKKRIVVSTIPAGSLLLRANESEGWKDLVKGLVDLLNKGLLA